MRAIITVVGQDTVGILASVSRVCAEHNANVIEVTQSVLEELFVMVMLVTSTICPEASMAWPVHECAGKREEPQDPCDA